MSNGTDRYYLLRPAESEPTRHASSLNQGCPFEHTHPDLNLRTSPASCGAGEPVNNRLEEHQQRVLSKGLPNSHTLLGRWILCYINGFQRGTK